MCRYLQACSTVVWGTVARGTVVIDVILLWVFGGWHPVQRIAKEKWHSEPVTALRHYQYGNYTDILNCCCNL